MYDQLYLFEPEYLIDPNNPFFFDESSASERRTVGGEQASESGGVTEGDPGLSYVNSRTQWHTHKKKNKHTHIPERKRVMNGQYVKVDYYPQARLIIMKAKKRKAEMIQYDDGIIKVVVEKIRKVS